jgi:hypothetical protein
MTTPISIIAQPARILLPPVCLTAPVTFLMMTVGATRLMTPSARKEMLVPFPDLVGTAASCGFLISISCGALAIWLYAQGLVGSVANFGATIVRLSRRVWVLLPITEPSR